MVSIIIPVYNGEKYIEECINSCIKQSYRDIEIIIVDDGSSDSTISICETLERKDNRIVIIRKKNGGVSSARNMGIDVCSGEFIMFLDSDDYIVPNLVEKIMDSYHDLSPDLIVSGMKKVTVEGNDIYRVLPSYKYVDDSKMICELILDSKDKFLYKGPCCKLYKSDIIKNNKIKFDENLYFGEDTCFVIDYLRVADSCLQIQFCGYIYRDGIGKDKQYNLGNPEFQWNISTIIYKKRICFFKEKGCYELYKSKISNLFTEMERFFLNMTVVNGAKYSSVKKYLCLLCNVAQKKKEWHLRDISESFDKILFMCSRINAPVLLYLIFYIKARTYNSQIWRSLKSKVLNR